MRGATGGYDGEGSGTIEVYESGLALAAVQCFFAKSRYMRTNREAQPVPSQFSIACSLRTPLLETQRKRGFEPCPCAGHPPNSSQRAWRLYRSELDLLLVDSQHSVRLSPARVCLRWQNRCRRRTVGACRPAWDGLRFSANGMFVDLTSLLYALAKYHT